MLNDTEGRPQWTLHVIIYLQIPSDLINRVSRCSWWRNIRGPTQNYLKIYDVMLYRLNYTLSRSLNRMFFCHKTSQACLLSEYHWILVQFDHHDIFRGTWYWLSLKHEETEQHCVFLTDVTSDCLRKYKIQEMRSLDVCGWFTVNLKLKLLLCLIIMTKTKAIMAHKSPQPLSTSMFR